MPKRRFLDMNLSISNVTVSTKIYDKRGDLDFDVGYFLFLDGDVPLRTSYWGVLIRFARSSSNVSDFNCRIKQGLRYHKFCKAFSKFYRRHCGFVEIYSVSLKKLLQQGISEPEFYGDSVYKIRKIVRKSNFSEQLRKLINHYQRMGYNPYIMRQTACLVVSPIKVDTYSYVLVFNCTALVRASDSMAASS